MVWVRVSVSECVAVWVGGCGARKCGYEYGCECGGVRVECVWVCGCGCECRHGCESGYVCEYGCGFECGYSCECRCVSVLACVSVSVCGCECGCGCGYGCEAECTPSLRVVPCRWQAAHRYNSVINSAHLAARRPSARRCTGTGAVMCQMAVRPPPTAHPR